MDERCNIREYEDANKELKHLMPRKAGIKRHKGTKYPEALVDPNAVRQITSQSDGSVLVATIDGVYRFKDGKGELIS